MLLLWPRGGSHLWKCPHPIEAQVGVLAAALAILLPDAPGKAVGRASGCKMALWVSLSHCPSAFLNQYRRKETSSKDGKRLISTIPSWGRGCGVAGQATACRVSIPGGSWFESWLLHC